MGYTKGRWLPGILVLLILTAGCEVLLIGGAATAGYKLSTDQKTVHEAVDDSRITASIKTRLLEDPHVQALNVDVDTNLGEVTLSGYLRSQEEIERAVILCKGVRGVKNVVSLLKVRQKTQPETQSETQTEIQPTF